MNPTWLLIVMVLAYYGTLITLLTRRGQAAGRKACDKQPYIALCLTAVLGAGFLFYSKFSGGIDWSISLQIFAYLGVPSLVLWQIKNQGERITWLDWVAIAMLWLPFDLHLIGRREHRIKDALDWPLTAISGVLIGLAFWVCLRRIEGTKMVLKFSWKDFAKVFAGLSVLLILLLPLGFASGFLVPRDFWRQELAQSSLPSVIWKHLATWKFLWYLIKIYITIGISEEFMFRGIIQNFLEKTLNRPNLAWFFASILFGLAHLNNGARGLAIWDWNWTYAGFATIAGLAYGQVFRHSRSILYAVLLHALVDSIWHTFFL
ncbi:MAG: CPBP family intramembrane metalloprotease [Candidatus Doudnabacteria bacterium]|nr:CPBP family intramembrane metalloprotease [Candidatus Doudnabacteria bacterium]